MPTQLTEYIIWDLAALMTGAASWWWTVNVDPGLTGQTYSNTVHDGYRAIEIQATSVADPTFNFLQRYICPILAATETCPGQVVATSPNRWQITLSYDLITGSPDWATQLAQAQTYGGFVIADVLTQWCNAFVTQNAAFEIRSMFNKLSTAVFSFNVLTDALAFLYVVNVDGWATLNYPDSRLASEPNPASNVQVVTSNDSAQLKKLTDAVQQIANTDYNISINHGQSIFSVKGKVIT